MLHVCVKHGFVWVPDAKRWIRLDLIGQVDSETSASGTDDHRVYIWLLGNETNTAYVRFACNLSSEATKELIDELLCAVDTRGT